VQIFFLVDQYSKASVFDWVSLGFSLYMMSLPVLSAAYYGRSFGTAVREQMAQPDDGRRKIWPWGR
jgi:hypothetical protein